MGDRHLAENEMWVADGELSPEAGEHLLRCVPCAAERRACRELVRALDLMAVPDPPSDLVGRCVAGLLVAEREREISRAVSRETALAFLAAAVATATTWTMSVHLVTGYQVIAGTLSAMSYHVADMLGAAAWAGVGWLVVAAMRLVFRMRRQIIREG